MRGPPTGGRMCSQRGELMKSIFSVALRFGVLTLGLAPAISHAATAAAAPLTPYTAPDKSASAGVPAGWKVTKGQYGVIQMSGPKGEQIVLGNGIFVRNGAFQAGAATTPPIGATMPAQASLSDKYRMLWQQAAAAQGQPMPQISIISATPIRISPAIAECGTFLGTMTNAQGASKFETQFCSTQPDSGGIFKLIWKNASVPTALVQQERATAEAVLRSYRISPATLKVMLTPLTPVMPAMARPMPGMAVAQGMGSTTWGEISSERMATCMDLGVIRDEPEWRLPSYCN